MKEFLRLASGMGLLIGIYLFLSNPSATVSIINSIASAGTSTVKTLQARG